MRVLIVDTSAIGCRRLVDCPVMQLCRDIVLRFGQHGRSWRSCEIEIRHPPPTDSYFPPPSIDTNTPSTAHISPSTFVAYQEINNQMSCPKRTKPPRCQYHRAPRLAEGVLGTLWALLASCCLQRVLRNLYKVYIAIAAELAMLRHAT